MEYYLSFALVIIFFQLCVDVFIHGVLELFHGWKIYDYLVSHSARIGASGPNPVYMYSAIHGT